MHYCSQFIKLTLHIRKLNEFLGDPISGNYRMSRHLKGVCVGVMKSGLSLRLDLSASVQHVNRMHRKCVVCFILD